MVLLQLSRTGHIGVFSPPVWLNQAVRDDDGYQGLPIVAVTSVAGDEAERIGLEAGIDRYLIKLDRDEIFKACEDFLVPVTC